MCGIWLLFSKSKQRRLSDGSFYSAFMRFKARGPENSDFKVLDQYNTIIGFHRLAINGLVKASANQPFMYDTDEKVTYVMCNGEIYNYKELATKYDIQLFTGSDCEIIYPLYQKIGKEKLMQELDVEASIIICELNKLTREVKMIIGRDHCGIRPLFVSYTKDEICFSSEKKGIPQLKGSKQKIMHFPPRCYIELSSLDDFQFINYNQYFKFEDIRPTIFNMEMALTTIREEFIDAVKSRMMCDREFACLLSGGLDSSLVSAIASDIQKSRGKVLTTFCVCMDPNSPDPIWAQKVADHIGSRHITIVIPEVVWLIAVLYDSLMKNKEIVTMLESIYNCDVFALMEEYGIDASIVDIIETYDITTVRASTGQYLVSKWIAKNHPEIKVLLIGDGSDELTGGYIYMLKAPSHSEFFDEILKLLNDIHYFDVLRSDRGIASNGLEARVPFLRRQFISAYLSIDVSLRMPSNGVEKSLLRDAFKDTNLLPPDALYRKKEAFSDGVSKKERSWFSILTEIFEKIYTNEEFITKSQKYLHNTPPSKESLYYREWHGEKFDDDDEDNKTTIRFWLPNWSGGTKEPSARTLEHYSQ
jgi:asparagine synthase (glutamine-hydrolysing)